MRGSRRAIGISASIVALFIVGCARTHVPDHYLASPAALQTDTYGGWVYVKCDSASDKKTAWGGELIAISTDSMYIANETFHVIAMSSVSSAQLVAYASNAGKMGFMVAAGAFASISNGVFFLITTPLWIIGGGITAGERSEEPIVLYQGKGFGRFAPFARFPQGLPPGIDRNQIRMKQGHRGVPSRSSRESSP